MLGKNVTVCRILEYKIQKTLDILFRILYLILLRLASEPCKLLTYRLETRWLATFLLDYYNLIDFQLVTLHLLACNLVILSASTLIQSLINPIKIGLFKECIFLAGSLWHPLHISRRTNIKCQTTYLRYVESNVMLTSSVICWRH